MPSVSAKQAKLMRAVAHGWHPSNFKGPTKAVAKEFEDADERKSRLDKWANGKRKKP